MPALLALLSATTFGVADFIGGLATRRHPVVAVTLVTNLAGAVVAAVLVLVLGGAWTVTVVTLAALGGVAGLAGLVLLYSGLALGPNKVVSPLSAVVAAVVPVTVGVGLGERPSTWAVVGLAVTPVAIWAVAGGELGAVGAERRPVLMAVGAGLGFGLFFALLAQVPDGAGAVPLLVARTVSVPVLVVVAAAMGTRPPPPGEWPVPLVAGSLDMTANGLFLWASGDGELAIIGALVSLFPATTVILAVVVLGERLSRPQVGGLGLCLAAAVLLS